MARTGQRRTLLSTFRIDETLHCLSYDAINRRARNGGFLSEGLIDEVSVMIAPGIDGRSGQPALFDGIEDSDDYRPLSLKFKEISTFPNGVIWARYTVL